MDAYSDELLEHFEHPHNRGLIEAPAGAGAMRNPVCGDFLQVTVEVEDGMVRRMGWEGKGCLPSLGAASILSEIVRGRPVGEAMGFDEDQLIAAVGGLPTTKLHSAALAIGALRAALRQYQAGQD